MCPASINMRCDPPAEEAEKCVISSWGLINYSSLAELIIFGRPKKMCMFYEPAGF
jgi:hypothetical protein